MVRSGLVLLHQRISPPCFRIEAAQADNTRNRATATHEKKRKTIEKPFVQKSALEGSAGQARMKLDRVSGGMLTELNDGNESRKLGNFLPIGHNNSL